MTSEIAPHLWFPEPKLSFHPARKDDIDTHPLKGLLRFGPYSSGWSPIPSVSPRSRPSATGARLYNFMKELNSEYEPSERKDYLPKWPGFRRAFNLDMRGAAKSCHVELDDRLEAEMRDLASPHVVLVARLIRAIQTTGDQPRRIRRDLSLHSCKLVGGFLRSKR